MRKAARTNTKQFVCSCCLLRAGFAFLWSILLRCINMATKKRKEDEDIGLDKKRRKSGVAANGAELHGAASAAEEQQPIVSFID